MSEYGNRSGLVPDSIAIRSAHVTLDRIALSLINIVGMFSSFYIVTKRSTTYILTNYKLGTRRVTHLLLNQTTNQ